MENNNHYDNTEDFSLLMDDDRVETENLESTIDDLNEKLSRETPKVQDEIHISDIDEDFSDILRKRKRKRLENTMNIEEKKPAKKRKLKKWVYALFLIVLLGIGGGSYIFIHNRNVARKLAEEAAILGDIESHFSKYAKITKDAIIYEKNGSEYQEVGMIYKDTNVELVEEEIKLDTKYFHIKDFDYYIAFEDVTKGEEQEKDTRYKNYVPFNINIVTKDKFTLYLEDQKLITLNKEMEFPVIINNYENKYYVEYNDMLVNISKDDVSKTKESKNTEKKNQSKMTTLAYHRIYAPGESCTDGYVCMKKENFDKQMKYLVDNNYFTLSIMEFYMYMKGNLQIEKGVLITLDDGLMFRTADEVLDKYHLKATGFVTTSLGVDTKGYKAIEAQSHTHNLHRNYVCAGGNQGGAILCTSKANIVADLKKAIEILGTEPIGLAFPFYDYNDNAIAAVKEAGYKMAFVGRAGAMGKATPKVTDLYKIPRMTVWEESIMSFNTWKTYL